MPDADAIQNVGAEHRLLYIRYGGHFILRKTGLSL
jgi:hypothetical protein